MKKSKFTDSQIMDSLKRVMASSSVPKIGRELGIYFATFYKWRAKFIGKDVSMITRLKELEAENELIADWLRRLTANKKNRGFGLCFLFIRNAKASVGTTSVFTASIRSWS